MSPSRKTINELLTAYPFLSSFLEDNNINYKGNEDKTLREIINLLDKNEQEELAINIQQLEENLESFIEQMSEFLSDDDEEVTSITIFPGTDKSGAPEKYESLELKKGEIVCIVGPTGSGKSRLLGDIEWVAQNDTPTKRRVLVNNSVPDSKWRFSISDKLVAQLSQNMNFVMDLTVEEFVTLHAESRMIEDIEDTVKTIISNANNLAGERFSKDTPITSLSGGQSRALMIADTATLSKSPVILIDEIENAGIDRKRALDLLLAEDKIVLLATHDPTLALLGNRRIVIKNGGIDKIIETSEEEREILAELEVLDKRQMQLRNALRHGEKLQ